ncbi:MAG TPA: hypothetical protein VH189_06890 [Rhizomicrobium sp.]|nr:hypothetical protein [Rhizomicrobium sp.]
MRHIWWLLVPAFLSLAATAQARPRDDALSGAIRCGVVANSRQWLDCYYGAAQPVRAALGLGSALPAQIALAASPPSGGQPLDEAVRAEVVSAAANCMRVSEDRPWLDCYYGAAAPMRAQLGLSAPQAAARPVSQQFAVAPAPLPVTPAAPTEAAPLKPPPMPRRVGILGGLFSDPTPVVRDMPMQSFVLNKDGAFTITLIDGEVWEQSPEDEIYHRARWHREPAEMRVTIKPDTMHIYVMTILGENYMYKVHRIR